MQSEIEIKLRLAGLEEGRALLERHGFTVSKPRVFERNLVFDTADSSLKNSRRLLRLREAGLKATLTFKGPAEAGRHKSREEREVSVGAFDEMRVILERLGYSVTFTYDKHRTEFQKAGAPGVATLDETPVGTFMELEGSPEWIDKTAAALGFSETQYITASYATLYGH